MAGEAEQSLAGNLWAPAAPSCIRLTQASGALSGWTMALAARGTKMQSSSNSSSTAGGKGGPLVDTNTQPSKRARVTSPSDKSKAQNSSVQSNRAHSASPNVFLIIKRKDGSFDKVSPFYVQKGLEGIAGPLKSVKRLRNGTMLVETNNAKQVSKFEKATHLGEFPIEMELHNTLNYSKGVVNCRDLIDLPLEELKKEWARDGVVDVQHMLKRVNGMLEKTDGFIITFNTTKLPEHIKAGYLRLTVRPYIPNPMRCFKCQRYGHTTMGCNGEAICGSCSQAVHEGTSCLSPPKCVNCSGNHPVWSRECTAYLQERKIQELKTLKRISYGEAKKMFQAMQPATFATSFAATLKKPVAKTDASTQTEVQSVGTNTCVCECRCGGAVAPTPTVPSTTTEKAVAPLVVELPAPQPSGPGKCASTAIVAAEKTVVSTVVELPAPPQVDSGTRVGAATVAAVAPTPPVVQKQQGSRTDQPKKAPKPSDHVNLVLSDGSFDSASDTMEFDALEDFASPRTKTPGRVGSSPTRRGKVKSKPRR